MESHPLYLVLFFVVFWVPFAFMMLWTKCDPDSYSRCVIMITALSITLWPIVLIVYTNYATECYSRDPGDRCLAWCLGGIKCAMQGSLW
jgi:hypothetical protein